MTDTASAPPLPAALQGVWRRSLLDGPGIAPDTQSTVLWLQTGLWHADLRLPPMRPDFSSVESLSGCTPDQHLWLSGQQGFAGITTLRSDMETLVCQWHRRIDFQPPRNERDIGTIEFDASGAVMEERGIDADYREIWQRLAGSQGETGGWRRLGAGTASILLYAGSFFMLVRDRRAPLPEAGGTGSERLRDLLERHPGAEHACELLDLEISFGNWHGADLGGTVVHSTLPWREGTQVFLDPRWGPLDQCA